MRNLKIFSLVALISGLLFSLASVLLPIIIFSVYTSQNGSIGIIGGADGPTAIYLTSRLFDGHLLFTLILGLTLLVCGGFCLIFKRTVTNNCRLKTTVLSLLISFFCASGLACFFIWYSIVIFHEMSKHSISYPLSIIGCIISFVAIVLTIIYYIITRKDNYKIKGIVIDILTSIIALPILFLLVTNIYAINIYAIL